MCVERVRQRLLTVMADAFEGAAHLSERTVVLTERYSASTLAISGLISSPDRSHDSILLSLLSRSAAKMAHQPSVLRLLSRKLPGGRGKHVSGC